MRTGIQAAPTPSALGVHLSSVLSLARANQSGRRAVQRACRKIDSFGRHMPSKQKSPRSEARRPVWAEVSLDALAYNLEAIKKFVNPAAENRKTPRKILSIVKVNGYGHGGPQVAKALEKAGSDWFGVTCTDEGIAVRENGARAPILVLTGFVPGEEARLIEYDLTPAVHRCDQLPLLESAAARLLSGRSLDRHAGRKTRNSEFGSQERATFHLKIDTGMNRLGISPTDVECFARQLAKCRHLQLTGIFSHFASSGVFTDTPIGRQTREQEECFYAAL